jgi:hypothetical protein
MHWTHALFSASLAGMKAIPDWISTETITGAKRALGLCLLTGLGLFLSACKHEADPPAASDLAGVYSLASVNGNEVPARVSHDGTPLEVRSGSFTFHPDGTCSTRTVFAPVGRGEVVREVSATYTRNGPKLTMRWKGAGMTTGTLQGDTFTMNNEGMVFVYTK